MPELLGAEAEALGPATSPRRRAQFALGRACAREALRLAGAPAGTAVGRRGGRLPQWPPGFAGAITHSHDWAAAAAAPASAFRGIGLDLERVRVPSDGLLARVARPGEVTRLAALPADERPVAFTATFAAKESLYKAVNPLTGVFLGFWDAEVEFAPDTDWAIGGDIAWRLERNGGEGFPLGYRGVGRWRRHAEWILAGAWIPA